MAPGSGLSAITRREAVKSCEQGLRAGFGETAQPPLHPSRRKKSLELGGGGPPLISGRGWLVPVMARGRPGAFHVWSAGQGLLFLLLRRARPTCVRYARWSSKPSAGAAVAAARWKAKRLTRQVRPTGLAKRRGKLAVVMARSGSAGGRAMLDEMLRNAGFVVRLSDEVLRYRGGGRAAMHARDEANAPVRVVDGALPEWTIRRLAAAFAPTAPFWPAHDYDVNRAGSRPFFSYVHALSPHGTPLVDADDPLQACVHAIRDAAAKLFPAVRRATMAEWWVHCRRHGDGHQLHFDSDAEGAGPNGPQHPICSAVVSLGPSGVGGPTLVTTLRSGDTTLGANKGWLVEPTSGRLTVFDGRNLHGVLPGRRRPSDPSARRITYMVAFWPDTFEARDGGVGDAATDARLAVHLWRDPCRKAWARLPASPTAGMTPAAVVPPAVRVWQTVDGSALPASLPPYEKCWALC